MQSRTKQAAEYAKAVYKVNPIYAQKAAGTAKNAYNIGVGGCHNPPVIWSIEWLAGQVHVSAHDDVLVTGVTVTILDESGQPLDQGEAELWMGAQWEYRTAHRGRIRVEARDLPGNVTCQEFSPASHSYSVWEKFVDTRS